MIVRADMADQMVCPIVSTPVQPAKCMGNACMMWVAITVQTTEPTESDIGAKAVNVDAGLCGMGSEDTYSRSMSS